MKTLTDKQAARLQKAMLNLPEGYDYNLHDTNNRHESIAVWGVTLLKDDKSVGYVGKNGSANCDASFDSDTRMALLNRVSSALWHKQPRWDYPANARCTL
jgi:hypothetical protein